MQILKKILNKKKGVLGLILAASLVMTGSFTTNAAGNWVETADGWKYKDDDGWYAKNQYIDGWYLDEKGILSYKYQASWRQDSTGWWYGDDSGWYAKNCLFSIDGKMYEFDNSGYLVEHGWKKDKKGWYYEFVQNGYASAEWIDGYWIGEDGYWTYEPRAQWYKDDKGWYYMDSSGFYEKNQNVKIDQHLYSFDDQGYLINFTRLESNTKTSELKLNVSLDKKDSAANQLQNLLIRLFDNGAEVKVKIDGTEKSAKNDKGVILLDGKTLAEYINEVPATQNELEVSFDTTSHRLFSTIFSGMVMSDDYYKHKTGSGITDDDTHFDHKMTFGGVTISNIDFSVSYGARLDIGFDVEDKQTIVLSSNIIGDDGEMIPSLDVLGKHIEDDWVKKLVDSGVINEEVYIIN